MNRLLAIASSALLALSACAGPPGPEGPSGDTGPAGPAGPPGAGAQTTPSLSSVSPGHVFPAASYEVRLTGDDTSWADGATVDFGAGITVTKVTVASRTGLIAEIEVAEDANAGARDVTVHDGMETVTYAGGFFVDGELQLGGGISSVPQGGIVVAPVKNLNFAKPFYPGDGTFRASTEFGTVAASTPPNISDAVFTISADVFAPPGPQTIVATSSSGGSTTTWRAPDAYTVTPATPTPVTGATFPFMAGDALESKLFVYTAPQDEQVTISVTSSDASQYPQIALIPDSGRMRDATFFDTSQSSYLLAGDKVFVQFWDYYGGAHYPAQLATATIPMALQKETEPNDSAAAAQPAKVAPLIVLHATLKNADDADWYRILVTTADLASNPWLHIETHGSFDTDTVLTVYAPDGSTLFAGPSDTYFQETLDTPYLTQAGAYYIEVTPSTVNGYMPNDAAYWLRAELAQ